MIVAYGKNRKLESKNCPADILSGNLINEPNVISMNAILTNMKNWQHFTDSRFALRFQYPKVTPQGHLVEKAESQAQDRIRVHFTSKDSREVYFEITKYHNISAQMEYHEHKESLEKRPEGFLVSGLKEICWMSQRAYEYSIEWSQAARVVRLIEIGDSIYRVLYDPGSPLNLRILYTLKWMYQ